MQPDQGRAGEVAVRDSHTYHQRTKVVRSGQVRIYYAASCACGWRCEQFRVTDERAVTDWFEHTEKVDA